MDNETVFYRRSNGGGLSSSDLSPRIANRSATLPAGHRYALVEEQLRDGCHSRDLMVELGCGNGEFLRHLNENYRYKRAVGIDIAVLEPVLLDGIEYRNDNLNARWPFENHSIDCLIAMMVFEHLFDPFHCFEEVYRTMSHSGVAFVNVPLVTNLKNRLRIISGDLPETSVQYSRWFVDRVWDGNHLHYFSVRSLMQLAECSGLKVVNVRGVGRLHKLKTFWPALLAGEVTIELRRLDQTSRRSQL